MNNLQKLERDLPLLHQEALRQHAKGAHCKAVSEPIRAREVDTQDGGAVLGVGLRSQPYRKQRGMKCDSPYIKMTIYPTEAEALAAIKPVEEPKISGTADKELENRLKDAVVLSNISAPVHISTSDKRMIVRDGIPDHCVVEPAPEESPHPHADSWVPAFGMSTVSGDRFNPLKRFEV